MVPEFGDAFMGRSAQVPFLQTFVVRDVQAGQDYLSRAYVSLSSAAITTGAYQSRASWINDVTGSMRMEMEFNEATYWLLQRARRTAEQGDLLTMVLLTGVTIFSLSRVMVKLILKLHEKVS
jgi:hypothetical protein